MTVSEIHSKVRENHLKMSEKGISENHAKMSENHRKLSEKNYVDQDRKYLKFHSTKSVVSL